MQLLQQENERKKQEYDQQKAIYDSLLSRQQEMMKVCISINYQIIIDMQVILAIFS